MKLNLLSWKENKYRIAVLLKGTDGYQLGKFEWSFCQKSYQHNNEIASLINYLDDMVQFLNIKDILLTYMYVTTISKDFIKT